MSKTTYIQFVNEVPGDGDFASFPFWSASKHGKTVQPEERWPWLVLHFGKTDELGSFVRSGVRRRTPIHNIVSVSEEGEEQLPKASKEKA